MTVTVVNERIDIVTVEKQGPAGPSSGPGGEIAEYTHTQSAPAASWTINHNLGRKPLIALRSAGGVEFEGTITHISDNQAVVTLAAATAGYARCL